MTSKAPLGNFEPQMTQPRMTQPQMKSVIGETLVVASHNEGKVREIRELLAPFGIKTLSAAELGLDEPVEDGLTFAANADLKARAAAQASGLPALSDDSGLAVEALGGEPGIYSARWAGEPRDFGLAMEKVEAALHDKGAHKESERRARFVCSLCLAFPGAGEEIFEGTVEGTAIWPPRGTGGFGYDPIFQPLGEDITFGEMEPLRKQAMSHRARAFEKFVAWLSSEAAEG